MKKLLNLLLVFVMVFAFASCKGGKEEKRTYLHDGDFSAFALQYNYGAPQITSVTVTIKNDKIEKFFIDSLQSNYDEGFAWNAKTKKELGGLYHMFPAYVVDGENVDQYMEKVHANGKLEWFEQAALIEAALLEKGVDGVTLDASTGKFTNVANVTVSDNEYVALAKAAVENAKAGKVVAYKAGLNYGAPQVNFVEATINKDGKVTAVKLNATQSTLDDQTNKHVWNAKSKQELGGLYHMHSAYVVDGETVEQYMEKVHANGKLEWFEQVELICNAWLGGTTLALDASTGKFTNVASVSISDNDYVALLNGLLSAGWTR